MSRKTQRVIPLNVIFDLKIYLQQDDSWFH